MNSAQIRLYNIHKLVDKHAAIIKLKAQRERLSRYPEGNLLTQLKAMEAAIEENSQNFIFMKSDPEFFGMRLTIATNALTLSTFDLKPVTITWLTQVFCTDCNGLIVWVEHHECKLRVKSDQTVVYLTWLLDAIYTGLKVL